MAIKVICPSCGRTGRVPDQAIGKTAQCPGCGSRHKLTAADVLIEELELVEDDTPVAPAPAKSAPSPASARPPRAAQEPAAAVDKAAAILAGHSVRLDEGVNKPPAKRSNVPIWAGVAAALVLVVGVGLGVLVSRLGGPKREANDAPAPFFGGATTAAAPTPAQAAPKNETVFTPPTATPGVPPPTPPAGASSSQVDAGFFPPPPGTALPATPNPLATTSPPATAPIAPVGPAVDPTSSAQPDREPDYVLAARASAATAARQRVTPPTQAMSTADIVAESEQSVALIKGKSSSGTGFLVAPGLLATNAHVIEEEFMPNIEVRFPSAEGANKGPLSCELLYEDRKRDLAFLAVRSKLPPLRVAQAYGYRKGEDVTVIGNPGLGDGDSVLENAISRGVMSTRAEIEGQKFYQLGIAVNPGNSGGPVFDSKGQVIGVVTLRIPGKEQLSFCIPVEELQAAIARVGGGGPSEGGHVRSRHRAVSAFKVESSVGALYSLALEFHLALQMGGGDKKQELSEQMAKVDEVLESMQKGMLFGLTDQANRLRTDPLLITSTREKLKRLGENFNSLRNAYERTRSSTPLENIRMMKATHRQLITELKTDLNVELPENLMAALEDHLQVHSAPDNGSSPFPPAFGPGGRAFPRSMPGLPRHRRFGR